MKTQTIVAYRHVKSGNGIRQSATLHAVRLKLANCEHRSVHVVRTLFSAGQSW